MTNTEGSSRFYLSSVPTPAQVSRFDVVAWDLLDNDTDPTDAQHELVSFALPILCSRDLVFEVLACMSAGEAAGLLGSLVLLADLGILDMSEYSRIELGLLV